MSHACDGMGKEGGVACGAWRAGSDIAAVGMRGGQTTWLQCQGGSVGADGCWQGWGGALVEKEGLEPCLGESRLCGPVQAAVQAAAST